jgi:AIPR protein
VNPLIQGLFNSFCETEELTNLSDSDSFELFAANLALSPDLVTQVEQTDLLLDASTIGVDVAILEINGRVTWDATDVDDICKDVAKIEVGLHLIQAKRSHKVDTGEILSFGDTARRVVSNEQLQGSPKLSAISGALARIFSTYARALKASPSVSLYYATTAPRASIVDPTVVDRCNTVAEQLRELGFLGSVEVQCIGADELHAAWVRLHNANQVEISLEKQINLPEMPGVDQAILGVISLEQLIKLISKADDSLDERIFYDNVRGFQGEANTVNGQILDTLATTDRAHLPVLNNGVTVVARSYSPKPGDAISLSDYQVVNGCQTSHCVYLSKEAVGDHLATTYVPLRIVVTSDEDIASRIVGATNSQTEVNESDLIALTKFQKKLEDFYRSNETTYGLTYERRSGQFFGKEVTKTRVVRACQLFCVR